MKLDPLNEKELQMWLALIRGMATVNRKLADDMRQEHGLHITWYDVLVQLYIASEHRLTMSDLAERIIISGSGLTRLLDKMVETELIERTLDPEDRRLVYACLTEAGVEKASELMLAHQQRIRKYVMQYLTEKEIETIKAAFARILANQ